MSISSRQGTGRPASTEPRWAAGMRPPMPAAVSREMSKAPRRYGQWAATVLVVLVAVLGAGWAYSNKGGTVEVLVLDRAVPAGHVIERNDLGSANVSGVSDAIKVADLNDVVGKRAAVGLIHGQILTSGTVVSDPLPGPQQRMVAVSVTAGRVPSTLAAGTTVDLLGVPAEGDTGRPSDLSAPVVVAAGASTYSVHTAEDGSVVVTLLVSAVDANQVAAYNAAGRLTLIQAPVAEE